MLKDVTFGQYFPGDSVIHKMDPRMKLILIIVYIVMLFVADGIIPLMLGVAVTVFAYALSKLSFKLVWRCVKPILPIVIFTAVLNIFFIEGDPIFQWKFISISERGVITAVLMCVRIISLIAGSSLLTYTTTPIALTDGLERLMKPLAKIKVPVHELSMMMTIASIFSIIAGTDEALAGRASLWQELKAADPKLYRYCRWSFTNVGTNLPGKEGRKLSVSLYHMAQKLYKFN